MNDKNSEQLGDELATTLTVEDWDKTYLLVPEDFSEEELIELQRMTKRKTQFVNPCPFEKPEGFESHLCLALDKPPGTFRRHPIIQP